MYRSFTSLVRFIPSYFIIFEAIVKEIVFLLSLSVTLLLAYRNATNFWILILYPANLLNSFISFSDILVESVEFSIYSVLSSSIMTVLLLPFQFGCLLFLLLV